MKRYICLFLSLLLMVLFVGCRKVEDSKEVDAETTKTIGIYEKDVFSVKTDYCVLKYPKEWKDKVTVAVSDNKVTFTHTETNVKVFDIVFDEGDGYVLGVIKGKNKDTVVRIYNYDLDETSAEFQTYCAIAENVNVIINHLSADYDFELGN